MKAAFRERMPKEMVPTIVSHDGPFGADEVERYARKAPALILNSDGGNSERRGNLIYARYTYDLFIVVTGKTYAARTIRSRLIVQECLKTLHSSSAWQTEEDHAAPENVKSKNLYGKKTDEMGLSLWVVRWDQLLLIPYANNDSDLGDFATLWVDYFRPGESPPDDDPILQQQIELETL